MISSARLRRPTWPLELPHDFWDHKILTNAPETQSSYTDLKLTAKAPEKWWLELLVSFWDGLFSGAMLVSGSVPLQFLILDFLHLVLSWSLTWPETRTIRNPLGGISSTLFSRHSDMFCNRLHGVEGGPKWQCLHCWPPSGGFIYVTLMWGYKYTVWCYICIQFDVMLRYRFKKDVVFFCLWPS